MLHTRLLVITFVLLFTSAAHAAGGAKPTPDSSYVSLEPAQVVNVTDGETVRHMQVKCQLKLEDPAMIEQIEKHKPAIQHEMVMILSGKPVAELRTVNGKEALRKELLTALQKLLTENAGKPVVEAVYFTEFIIQ